MTSGPDARSDRWRRANDLFHRALDLEPDRREQFLVDACGGDDALRSEVRALLGAHGRGDRFLEQPTVLSSPPAAASYATPGEFIGPYRVQRILGEGGMGVVYLAWDDALGRDVALKAVSPAYTHDPVRRERLRREARAAARLTHPGIATVYVLEEHGGDFFIVSEYVAGETLREEIARGPLPIDRVLDTALGIAAALAAAHDRDIVHRDIKPENIMRTPAGEIKVLDFGLARARDASTSGTALTDHGTVLGTPGYMAPEQIRQDPIDTRTDIFAVGILLYEMAVGRHPFAGQTAASTMARILEVEVPPLEALSGLDAQEASAASKRSALDAIIRTCLRKRPDARFANGRDLLAALERAKGTRPLSIPVTLAVRGSQGWWKVHQMATCIAYAGLMVPMWEVRRAVGGRPGFLLFLAAMAAVVASIVLRMHLWFTVASMPDEWRRQSSQATPWVRVADGAAVAGFLTGGLLLDNPGPAAILVGAAVICAVSFLVIEPATTRAAFGQDR